MGGIGDQFQQGLAGELLLVFTIESEGAAVEHLLQQAANLVELLLRYGQTRAVFELVQIQRALFALGGAQ